MPKQKEDQMINREEFETAIKASNMQSTARAVALEYASHGKYGEVKPVWPSKTRVANQTGFSTETVGNKVKELIAGGWLIPTGEFAPLDKYHKVEKLHLSLGKVTDKLSKKKGTGSNPNSQGNLNKHNAVKKARARLINEAIDTAKATSISSVEQPLSFSESNTDIISEATSTTSVRTYIRSTKEEEVEKPSDISDREIGEVTSPANAGARNSSINLRDMHSLSDKEEFGSIDLKGNQATSISSVLPKVLNEERGSFQETMVEDDEWLSTRIRGTEKKVVDVGAGW